MKEKGKKGEPDLFYGKYEDGFENKFNVPFSQIYGLDEKEDQGSSHMGVMEWGDQRVVVINYHHGLLNRS